MFLQQIPGWFDEKLQRRYKFSCIPLLIIHDLPYAAAAYVTCSGVCVLLILFYSVSSCFFFQNFDWLFIDTCKLWICRASICQDTLVGILYHCFYLYIWIQSRADSKLIPNKKKKKKLQLKNFRSRCISIFRKRKTDAPLSKQGVLTYDRQLNAHECAPMLLIR